MTTAEAARRALVAPVPWPPLSAPPPAGAAIYPSIDILRGAAALSVLVYHVIEHFKWTGFPIEGALVWFRIGWMGVDLFLVISGFVIASSARPLLARLGYAGFLPAFARRRLARIVPFYAASCVVYAVLVVPSLLLHPALPFHAGAHALFVHNWWVETAGSIDGPNWSVALEMQFYLGFALLAPLLLSARWWVVGAAALAIAWGWRAGVLLLLPYEQPNGAFLRFWATTQLPGTLDEFASGILLARLLTTRTGAALLRFGRRWPVVPVGVAAIGVWAMLAVFWRHATYWDSAAMVVFWRSACGAAFASVLFAACCLQARPFLLLTAPLRYLGTISYGIYLWHLPVLLSVQRVEGLSPAHALAVILPATLLLAAGSWILIERPALRSRFARGPEAACR